MEKSMDFGVGPWLQLSGHRQVIQSLQASISTLSYEENSNNGINFTGLLGILVRRFV